MDNEYNCENDYVFEELRGFNDVKEFLTNVKGNTIEATVNLIDSWGSYRAIKTIVTIIDCGVYYTVIVPVGNSQKYTELCDKGELMEIFTTGSQAMEYFQKNKCLRIYFKDKIINVYI